MGKPIVGLIPPSIEHQAQPEEIDRIFYVPLRHIITAQPLPYPVQLNQSQFYMPSFQLDNEIIWGLTARILVSLFRRGLKQPVEWPLLMNEN